MFSNLFTEPLPEVPQPIHVLNTETSVHHTDIDYVKINNLYASMDPRTLDPIRSIRTYLDAPPLVSRGTKPQTDLSTIRTNTTGFYPNYQSIYGGDIKYYTDLSNDDPQGAPVFALPAYTVPELLVDPMGSVKPYYARIPVYKKNNSQLEYSFDQDQCEFREDLMALQLSKFNRSSFGAFQLFNDPKTYYPAYDKDFYGKEPLTQKNSRLRGPHPL